MLLKELDLNIISLIILILIFINSYNSQEKVFKQYNLFISLVQTNIIIIIIDCLSWISNGLPGHFGVVLNIGFNLLLFILQPLGAILWVMYADYQVFHKENRLRKLKLFLFVLFTINALLSIINVFSGWYYSVDSNNVYYRGDYYWIFVMFNSLFMIYSMLFIFRNRNKVEKRYYYTLLLFPLPLMIGGILQALFYGTSFCWTGAMISILVIYFNIQDRRVNTDYLTGAYNRRELDRYIKKKVQDSTADKSFSVILIDINKFKIINDELGHIVGDEALKDTVKLLRDSCSNNDFIARFGGDEFCVVLVADNHQTLDRIVEKINVTVDKFNKDSKKPYTLNLCMGYDVYNYKSKMNSTDFIKHLDSLMYDAK